MTLKYTPLNKLHKELGAKMVPFAGYEMPVQYSDGIIKEHKHTRNSAGLFDISHMGQIRLSGANVALELEALVPSAIQGLALWKQRYTVLTTPDGGIFDDVMITNAGDYLVLVVNAARKEHDLAYLCDNLSSACKIELMEDTALLSLQGPKAAAVMARLVSGIQELPFLNGRVMDIDGIECWVSRCGYTGDDGFELSVANDKAENLARLLLDQSEVAPIGLGARDSLRLEAGLCLYGQDIDEETTPIEANLDWVISSRRLEYQSTNFSGAELILQQLRNGPKRRRVGLLPQERAPVRKGAELTNSQGQVVGMVTSGGFSPSLGRPIAMAYIESAYSAVGTQLQALQRNQPRFLEVTKLPFVPHRYFSIQGD